MADDRTRNRSIRKSTESMFAKYQIYVKGVDDGIRKCKCDRQLICSKCQNKKIIHMSYSKKHCKLKCNYTPSQKWVLSVYDMRDNQKVVDTVNTVLIKKNIGYDTRIRRRLSPCEKFLRRLRQTTPHRDSPVLTRLLEE